MTLHSELITSTNQAPCERPAPIGQPGRLAVFPPRRRVVMAGIGIDAASSIALVRADALARYLSAELRVVHVVPARGHVRPLVTERMEDILPASPVVRATLGPTRRWSEAILGRKLPPGAVLIGRGPVHRAIERASIELDAWILVLGDGGIAHRLVRSARRPILVARRPTESRHIVAATDFTDPAFPALRLGAELGARMKTSVTFVGHDRRRFGEHASEEASRRPTSVALASMVEECGPPIDTAWAANAEGVLDIARARAADLVVVGVHPQSMWSRLRMDGPGVHLATTAKRSVLGVPLFAAR